MVAVAVILGTALWIYAITWGRWISVLALALALAAALLELNDNLRTRDASTLIVLLLLAVLADCLVGVAQRHDEQIRTATQLVDADMNHLSPGDTKELC